MRAKETVITTNENNKACTECNRTSQKRTEKQPISSRQTKLLTNQVGYWQKLALEKDTLWIAWVFTKYQMVLNVFKAWFLRSFFELLKILNFFFTCLFTYLFKSSIESST